MNHRVQITAEFGSQPADGAKALAYRAANLDRDIPRYEKITIDFTGVRISNSSFVNALVAGLIAEHGKEVLEKLIFKGCLPTVRVLVEAAIDLGLSKFPAQSI